MNVFLGKMNDADQCEKFICKAANEKYFSGIENGDYVFIRLKDEDQKTQTKRLWKFKKIDENTDGVTASFENVFEFKPIPLGDFIRLDLFKLNKNLIINVKRQVKSGFVKLDLVNEEDFKNKIKSEQQFNNYIKDPNNLRNVIFIANTNNVSTSDRDVQIFQDPKDGLFKIFNSKEDFLSDLQSNFDSKRYEKNGQFC